MPKQNSSDGVLRAELTLRAIAGFKGETSEDGDPDVAPRKVELSVDEARMVPLSVMPQCGWDCVTVDAQHGVQDYQTMVQCFQAMDRLPVTKLVRVPWNEPGIIGKVLDGGAYGVICPMVNSREAAQALVSYCRYPPKGQRSNGPIRAAMYGVAGDYQRPRMTRSSSFR